MFNWLKRFIVKRALPEIIDNIEIEIRTIEKARTKLLEVKVQIFDWMILHRQIPLADITTSTSGEVVRDIEARIKAGGQLETPKSRG